MTNTSGLNTTDTANLTEAVNETSRINTWHYQYIYQDFFRTIYSLIHFTLTLLKCPFLLPWWLLVLLCGTLTFCSIILIKKYLRRQSRLFGHNLPGDSRNVASNRTTTIGFFHPYCNAGGGGEKVLWCAIRSLQTRYDFVKCVVYTGDIMNSPDEIIKKARDRFGIDIKRHVHFVYLNRRGWVTAERYPILTLFGQSLGSLILGLEALFKFVPDIYLDTMGYAFTLPLFKYVGGCKIGCYVHYPTISTDMLEKVNRRVEDFNNAGFISRSYVLSSIKMAYYRLFAYVYGLCGSCSDTVMVNSSWTLNHINDLWRIPHKTSVVYPPCNTKSLLELSIDENESNKVRPYQILSIAQFRPEKNHSMQLKLFQKFLKEVGAKNKNRYKLVLVGGCRGVDDEKRVAALKAESRDLKIDKFVNFCVNISFEDLLDLLMGSTVGLHTMKDEHFGIGVVEFMAGGLVTLAHNSGGPKLDIVIDSEGMETGYLADTIDGYVHALREIFEKKKPHQRYEICLAARNCVKKRFSEETFKKRFLVQTECLLD